MTIVSIFVQADRLPDIRYLTVTPQETISPRVTYRDGYPMVYMHGERDAEHKGFVPVGEFLKRLAQAEPNLAVTGYRSNGRQTTISFNKSDRVTISPRLQAYLSSVAVPREGKSAAIVQFLGSLSPVYTREFTDEGIWARSLLDGTLVLPVDESEWDEPEGRVRVWWQGDAARSSEVQGIQLVAVVLERYVRHQLVGRTEEEIAAELWYMARHFTLKTGCHAFLPMLEAPPHPLVRKARAALRIGEGVLASAIGARV